MKFHNDFKNYELMVASSESTTIADRISARICRVRFFSECKANESDKKAKQERIITNARLAHLPKGKYT